MQSHHQLRLPPLDSISGEELLPWNRYWCELGGQIAMEGYGFSDNNRGFLAEPSKYSNANCRPLSQLITARSGVWILTGSPGNGKSGAIRRWLDEVSENEPHTFILACTSATFGNDDKFERLVDDPLLKMAQAEGRAMLIVIDGFDQFRTPGGLPFESLAGFLSRLQSLENLRLVIGCRARDWNAQAGHSLLSLWPKTEGLGVFEICPLTRAQVIDAVRARESISQELFFREVMEKRLEASGHWPLTLRSLLDNFARQGCLPQSLRDMVFESIELLISSHARGLAENDPAKRSRLLQGARRLAAICIFGGYEMISRSAKRNPKALSLADFCGSPGMEGELTANDTEFTVSGAFLHDLLGTALFTPVRPPTASEPDPPFGFTHQSYAELLAADYLRHLSVNQLVNLITLKTIGGEAVPAPLIETASWLGTINAEWFDRLLIVMPEILLRADGAQFTHEQKSRLVSALLLRVQEWDASCFGELRLLTPAFAFPGLADLLRPIILDQDAHPFSRRFAVEVAEEARVTELEDTLWRVLERGDDGEPSQWIFRALRSILKGVSLKEVSITRLKLALKGEMGTDDDDELKGVACLCLVPTYVTPREIAEWLTIPKNAHHIGAYQAFLREVLPSLIASPDLETFLTLGASKPSLLHAEFVATRLARKVLERFCEVGSPTVRMIHSFVRWVLRCAEKHTVLPLWINEYDPSAKICVIPLHKRIEWLAYVANSEQMNSEDAFGVLRALGLEQPPLEALLDGINTAEPDKKAHWAEFSRWAMVVESEREKNLPRLLQTYEETSELQAALHPCLEGMNIHETYCARAREGLAHQAKWAKRQANEKRKQINRRQKIDHSLNHWREGNELAWCGMWHACALREDGQMYDFQGELISNWGGWKSLTDKEQSEAIACARAFLLKQDDPNRENLVYLQTGLSESAAFAIPLLTEQLEFDAQLSEAIAHKWLIGWVHHTKNVDDSSRKLAAKLFPLNPGNFLSVLKRKFLAENLANANCWAVSLLQDCWDDSLTGELAHWLCTEKMNPVTLRTAIQFLATKDIPRAVYVCEHCIRKIDQNSQPSELEDSITYSCLLHTGGKLFDYAFSKVASLDQSKKLLLLGGSSLGSPGGGLAETLTGLSHAQLAKLTVMMTHAFPEQDWLSSRGEDSNMAADVSADELEDNAGIRVHEVTPSHSMRRVSSTVMAKFAQVATNEEFASLLPRLPESRRVEMAFLRSDMMRQVAQSEWQPISANALLRLVRSQHGCFIRTNDDLLDFVVLQLEAFAAQPWDVGVQPLWNEENGKPVSSKNEEALSNKLKRWLDGQRELVVNREVQPIETMPNRLDLKIDIPGSPALCVILEVKKDQNAGVITSMQTQLVDRYLKEGRQTHGIYLVACFGDKTTPFGTSELDKIKGQLTSLHHALSLPNGARVEPIVLDCRHPRIDTRKKRKSTSRSGKLTFPPEANPSGSNGCPLPYGPTLTFDAPQTVPS